MAKKTYNGVTYIDDPSYDYSVEIEKALAEGRDTSALVAEREAKIADKYGYEEPTMYNSNQTYSQLSSNNNSSSQRDIDNAIISRAGNSLYYDDGKKAVTNMGQSWEEGVDYAKKAWEAAEATYNKVGYIDLDEIDDILMRRQDKMDATGSTGGGLSNMELWNNILSAYNGALGPNMASTTGGNFASSNQTVSGNVAPQKGQRTTVSYGDGFSYTDAPDYYDAYQKSIDAALDKILNRAEFSYDASSDPIYQQYKDMYTREGERAMRDTLGEVSARTGGMASSYATTAAQQANQYYMQQLADKVPELYQMAYQMYLDDLNLQVQDLGLLQGASQDAYNRYRDTMTDWYNDRDFAYGAYRDDVADDQWQTQFDYNAERDSIADSRYENEWEYQVGRDELADQRYDKEWAYQLEQDRIAAANRVNSKNPTYADDVTAVAAYLGISEKEANALKNTGSSMYSKALTELGIGGSNGGGSGNDEYPIDFTSAREAVPGVNPTASMLATLEDQGIIESYIENGLRKFRRVKGGGGGQQLTAAAM